MGLEIAFPIIDLKDIANLPSVKAPLKKVFACGQAYSGVEYGGAGYLLPPGAGEAVFD